MAYQTPPPIRSASAPAAATGRSGRLAEICSGPLPKVPEGWLTYRWHPGRWRAHTERILTHPAYRDLYEWVAEGHPRRYEQWELMAAVAVAHAGRVAAGELSAEALAVTVAGTRRVRDGSARGQVLCSPAVLAGQPAAGGRARTGRLRRWDATAGGTGFESVLELVDDGFGHRPDETGGGPFGPDGEAASGRGSWPVVDWLVEVVGPGWLSEQGRAVLEDSLTLVADLADSRPAIAVPSARANPEDRITSVLAHLPRPARRAVRALVLGPAEGPLAGSDNSAVLWATGRHRERCEVPAGLVATWRYHAAALDPALSEHLAAEREPRRRLQRIAATGRAGEVARLIDAGTVEAKAA